MTTPLDKISLALFVPADRPDRYAKAFASGADAVILDLEDAVAASAKPDARAALIAASNALAKAPCRLLVRINSLSSGLRGEDLEAIKDVPFTGVVVAKAETVAELAQVVAFTGRPVVALVESARGLAAARSLASVAARLAFGSIDFANDLGCAHTRTALLSARSELVLASRLANLAGPIDGVTMATRDQILVHADAAYAAEIGFAGKLLIHPAQVAPALEGFSPTPEELEWAAAVLATGADSGATSIDGAMVDLPVRLRAEQIRQRSEMFRRRRV